MKHSIIYFLLLFSFFALQQTAIAQANQKHSFSLNFGPEFTAPESNFWETHKIGAGGSVKMEYTFGKHASATFNTGISFFAGKKKFEDFTNPVPSFYNQLMAIPAKGGIRYYFGNFYFLGEAGVVFLNNYANGTRGSFAAGIGDKINIGRQKIDVSLRQEIWLGKKEQLNMASLRVAYEIVW